MLLVAPANPMTFRIEDIDMPGLCTTYGVGTPEDCRKKVPPKALKKGGHGGETDAVTWAELEGIDADLATEVWDLAKQYGYDRDPRVGPAGRKSQAWHGGGGGG